MTPSSQLTIGEKSQMQVLQNNLKEFAYSGEVRDHR